MSTKDTAFTGALVILASLVIPTFIHFNELINESTRKSNERIYGIHGRLSKIEGKLESIESFTRYAIDSVDSQGKSPLYKAVANEDTEAASALIAAGADVNVSDSQGISPLLIAIYIEQEDIVSELIAAGADVNVRDNQGISPLLIAIYTEQEDIVDELIAAGAAGAGNTRDNQNSFPDIDIAYADLNK